MCRSVIMNGLTLQLVFSGPEPSRQSFIEHAKKPTSGSKLKSEKLKLFFFLYILEINSFIHLMDSVIIQRFLASAAIDKLMGFFSFELSFRLC